MGLGGVRGSPEVRDLPGLAGKRALVKGRAGGGVWGLWGDMGHAAAVQSLPRAPHREVRVLLLALTLGQIEPSQFTQNQPQFTPL